MSLSGDAPGPLAIVMPVLNEGAALQTSLRALRPLQQRGVLLVVADGGSTDGSASLAQPFADRVLVAPRGRAAQMHAGALAAIQAMAALSPDAPDKANDARTETTRNGAQGDANPNRTPPDPVLLFLHADTTLPPQADALVLEALRRTGRAWGRFDVRIDAPALRFRMVEFLMNQRSRLTGIATGDQAMFVRASAYRAVGGFADIALMEDIALSRALLRRAGRPACLKTRVVTSARRWQRHGFWRTVLLMWSLRAGYFFGMSPSRLARLYGYLPRG